MRYYVGEYGLQEKEGLSAGMEVFHEFDRVENGCVWIDAGKVEAKKAGTALMFSVRSSIRGVQVGPLTMCFCTEASERPSSQESPGPQPGAQGLLSALQQRSSAA